MFAWMYANAECSQKPEAGVGFPGTGTPGGSELPWRGWEANPGLLQEEHKGLRRASLPPLRVLQAFPGPSIIFLYRPLSLRSLF